MVNDSAVISFQFFMIDKQLAAMILQFDEIILQFDEIIYQFFSYRFKVGCNRLTVCCDFQSLKGILNKGSILRQAGLVMF